MIQNDFPFLYNNINQSSDFIEKLSTCVSYVLRKSK